jgi:hypothetical protein
LLKIIAHDHTLANTRMARTIIAVGPLCVIMSITPEPVFVVGGVTAPSEPAWSRKRAAGRVKIVIAGKSYVTLQNLR